MRKMYLLLLCLVALATARDLKSIPCQYIMPGEVLQSGSDDSGRFCVVNLSSTSAADSYLVQLVLISYSTDTIERWTWVALPICALSRIDLLDHGNRSVYMVDTLSEGMWLKRLYRRTCD